MDEEILWKQLDMIYSLQFASTWDSTISLTTMSKDPKPRQQHQKWLRISHSVLTSNNFTFESLALQKTFQYFSSSLRFFLSACYYFFPFYSALGCAPFAQHHQAMRYLICSYFYYLFSSSLRSYDFFFTGWLKHWDCFLLRYDVQWKRKMKKECKPRRNKKHAGVARRMYLSVSIVSSIYFFPPKIYFR